MRLDLPIKHNLLDVYPQHSAVGSTLRSVMRRSKVIDRKYLKAKELVEAGSSVAEACRKVGMLRPNYTRRDQKSQNEPVVRVHSGARVEKSNAVKRRTQPSLLELAADLVIVTNSKNLSNVMRSFQ